MELKTYRAATMYEALAMVRHDLGSDAAVLHTREVQSRRFFGWLSGPREIEVTASRDVNVPSRLPGRGANEEDCDEDEDRPRHDDTYSPGGTTVQPQAGISDAMQSQLSELQQMVQELYHRSDAPGRELPEELFQLFTDLLDSDLNEELARELVERVRMETRHPQAGTRQVDDPLMAKARLARMIEA